MLALATCCLMTLAMGTLHAWSVLSADLEATLGLTRAQSSLVYSLTLVTLTATVLLAVPLFSRLKVWQLFAGSSTLAGIGLYCSSSGSLPLLFAGYSVIFGIANGVGYGYALQLSAKVFSHRSGFAMGITTAAYALGATLGAQLLGTLVASIGALETLRLHGISFFLLAPVLALLIHKSKASYNGNSKAPEASDINRSLVNRYRLCYGLAVFAGLMAIAHATPYITSFGAEKNEHGNPQSMAASFAIWGAIVLGIGNAVGGVIAGYAADNFRPKSIIIILPIIASIALAVAAFANSAAVALASLVVIGFTYGALIAVYPVVIARHFEHSALAYGRIFIAWGVAGLLAPVAAGAIFDLSSGYQWSLLLAMSLSIASALLVTRLPSSTVTPDN